MARRDKGVGSLKYRKDKVKWQARIVTRYEVKMQGDGTQKKIPKQESKFFDTKGEAETWILSQRTQSHLVGSDSSIEHYMTGGNSKEALLAGTGNGKGWLEAKRLEIEPRTFGNYVEDYFRYMAQDIGQEVLDVRKLTTKRVREWQLDLANERTNYTANRAKALLANALGDAVGNGDLPYNVAAPIKNLKHVKAIKEIWTGEEILAMLKVSEGTKWHTYIYLGLMTGLRPAEMLGLCWDRIEIFSNRPSTVDQGLLHVNQSLVELSSGPALRLPKNSYSIRDLGLAKTTVEKLLTHRHFFKKGGIHDLVFPSRFEMFLDNEDANHEMKKLVDKTKVKHIGLYGLRHTFASIMIAKGMSPVQLCKLMGHERPDTTFRHYAHLFELREREPMPDLLELIADG